MTENKVLVITGPTATGKTALAFSLARKFGGELISADSRHVYKGMDIVTGKDLKGWEKDTSASITVHSGNHTYTLSPYRKDSVTLWMYDVVAPDEEFSVSAWVDCAHAVYTECIRRKRLPIIVGGTGLYISSFFHRAPSSSIPPDWKFRKIAMTMDIDDLTALLKNLSERVYHQMNDSDRHNPRRLIRRIEILRAHGEMPQADQKGDIYASDDALWIGLTAGNASLFDRIDRRVDRRISEGAIGEITSLYASFPSDLPSMSAIGYAQFVDKESHNELSERYSNAIQSWKFAEHGYARRQKTWLKKQSRIRWFDVDDLDFKEQVEAVVWRWYTKG